MLRSLSIVLAIVVSGCGSLPAAELPAPAGPPRSPELIDPPEGSVLTDSGGAPRDETLDGSCPDAVASAPLDNDQRLAVLCGRERALKIYDANTGKLLAGTGAGIGPTDVASDGHELLYVTDSPGHALLVYHLRPFELIRRVHLGGAPYAIAYDAARWGLWIALPSTNRLVNYAAGNRPVIRETVPAIRDARAVTVDGDYVTVFGKAQRQVLSARNR